VRIRRGPAAVTGDESCNLPLSKGREGAASRKIREPEDLPVNAMVGPRGQGDKSI